MSTLEVLIDSARRLPAARLSVLVDLANSLQRPVELEIDPNSDIVTKDFADDFSGRLLAYHALHEQKLTKKTFEYVFCSASRAAGRARPARTDRDDDRTAIRRYPGGSAFV